MVQPDNDFVQVGQRMHHASMHRTQIVSLQTLC